MDNILRDEVNQHTSDEVEKVLAELEAQGVDLTAIRAALEGMGTGSSGMKVKSFQSGALSYYNSSVTDAYADVSIHAVDPTKSIPFVSDVVAPVGSVLNAFSSAHIVDSDTLRIHSDYKRNASSVSGRYIYWFVIEFE